MAPVIRTTCQLLITVTIITKTIKNPQIWTSQFTRDLLPIHSTSNKVQWVGSKVTTMVSQTINKIDKENKVASVLQAVANSHLIMSSNFQMYQISRLSMQWFLEPRMQTLEVAILVRWIKLLQGSAILTKIMRQAYLNIVKITVRQMELSLTTCSLCQNMAQVVVSAVVSVP